MLGLLGDLEKQKREIEFLVELLYENGYSKEDLNKKYLIWKSDDEIKKERQKNPEYSI